MAIQDFAAAQFWKMYDALDHSIRASADRQFVQIKLDPHHPSLQFKKIGELRGGELWSARVTLNYRTLAFKADGYVWFWIGPHKAYDHLLSH